MTRWYESEDPGVVGRGAAWRIGVVVLVTILAIFAISLAVWGFRVVTSEPKGQGDAAIRKNSADNWVKQQARFEELYAEIVATDRKITVAAEALKANPDDRTAGDIYNGTRNVCLSFVADYNAAARSYLAADFRAADLPPQISDTDPTTDCQG